MRRVTMGYLVEHRAYVRDGDVLRAVPVRQNESRTASSDDPCWTVQGGDGTVRTATLPGAARNRPSDREKVRDAAERLCRNIQKN